MNVFHENKVPWPAGRYRTLDRKSGQFNSYGNPVTLAKAAERVEQQVAAFTRKGHPWRTNELWIYAEGDLGARNRFLANSKQRDPAVVVSFDLDGTGFTIPCDAFDCAAQNLAAIAATIEGLRAQERYGVVTIQELLTSYKALPEPGRKHWSAVIGPAQTVDEVELKRKSLARAAHPDAGGSDEAMAEINAACDAAIAEIRGRESDGTA